MNTPAMQSTARISKRVVIEKYHPRREPRRPTRVELAARIEPYCLVPQHTTVRAVGIGARVELGPFTRRVPQSPTRSGNTTEVRRSKVHTLAHRSIRDNEAHCVAGTPASSTLRALSMAIGDAHPPVRALHFVALRSFGVIDAVSPAVTARGHSPALLLFSHRARFRLGHCRYDLRGDARR